MAESTIITYGEGGFDPSKPNNNMVATETVDASDVPPDAATAVAQAIATLNPSTATIADVISSVQSALASVGATV